MSAMEPGDQIRSEPYLAAEAALWQQYDLRPTTHTVKVGDPPAIVRVQEVGSGNPVVFVHGTGGAGAYFAPLLADLDGFRGLVVDRPGWGLSEPMDYSRQDYSAIVSRVLRDVLDALKVERAHIVGASIGNLWALRFAMAEPSRVGRVVLLGGGPISPEVEVPTFIKLLRSPVGHLIVRVPEKPAMFRKQLAGMGHGASLNAGRIPEAFISWHGALTRHTSWGRHERDMVRSIVDRRGFVPGLVPTGAEVAALAAPVLMVYGGSDPVGGAKTWTRFMTCASNGELVIVEGGGHLVWLDDPAGVGSAIRRHLEH